MKEELSHATSGKALLSSYSHFPPLSKLFNFFHTFCTYYIQAKHLQTGTALIK